MGNDTESIEKAYTTKEIAIMLDIAEPTVRKYAQAMEKHGYSFATKKGTGKNLTRLFVEKDVSALRMLKHLRDETNITVDEASSLVIQRIGKGAIQSVATTDIALQNDTTSDIEAFKESMKELFMIQEENHQKEIQELKKMITEQNDRIEKRLEQRDKLLMETLNKSLEKQKQIASAEEQKRGFFSRLFKK